jgi:hypothetical protein
MDMYESRLNEQNVEKGAYNEMQAARDFEKSMLAASVDYLKELTFADQKAIHNLKYFTWIEQQEKPLEELNQLWNDHDIWTTLFNQVAKWDELIEEFNQEVKNA